MTKLNRLRMWAELFALMLFIFIGGHFLYQVSLWFVFLWLPFGMYLGYKLGKLWARREGF
jgi:hypothetical protein